MKINHNSHLPAIDPIADQLPTGGFRGDDELPAGGFRGNV